MTRDGFFSEGGARFEEGKAAEGSLLNPPVRGRLYTHRFPGAHSASQVEGAIGLAFAKVPERARPGQPVAFTLHIDNHRTGHKMPTGSADLRLLWLEVTAQIGKTTVTVPAKVKAIGGYGIAGGGELDAELLAKDVPAGSRIYRAIFFDPNGKQTLSSYDALRVVWDNRLEAGEKRAEQYELVLPAEAAGPVRLAARLVYLGYPTAFATRMEVPPAKPVEVASATATVEVAASASMPAVVPMGSPKR